MKYVEFINLLIDKNQELKSKNVALELWNKILFEENKKLEKTIAVLRKYSRIDFKGDEKEE